MNKIGIFYAYWVRNWEADYHNYIDKAADIGFDVLELGVGDVIEMSLTDRKHLKQHAADRNLTLTYSVGLSPTMDPSSPDLSTREKSIEYLKKICGKLGDLGGGDLGGVTYSSWPASMPAGESDKKPYFERSMESMKRVVRSAEENNVTFHLEVTNRYEGYLLTSCSEAVDYVDAINSPNVKILLDTFHMNIEEDFFYEAILKAGNRLGHFHIGENNRMPPGYGHIPWAEIGSAFRQINFTGCVVMEPFILPGGTIGQDIKLYRDLSQNLDLDQEARKALQFIRGVLK